MGQYLEGCICLLPSVETAEDWSLVLVQPAFIFQRKGCEGRS